MKKPKLPHVGMRILKSALCVFLCLFFSWLRGSGEVPYDAMIAALLCVQPYFGESKNVALQRVLGTLIGIVYALGAVYLGSQISFLRQQIYFYAFVSVGVILVLYTTILIDKKGVSFLSCVVFLSVALTYIEGENPVLFALNQAAETFAGIMIGIVVNEFSIKRRYRRDVLMVCDLDCVLDGQTQTLSAHSIVECNRMIAKGANLTFSTYCTSAKAAELLEQVELKLPVIVMDGAGAYDTQTKEYPLKTSMTKEQSRGIMEFLDEHHIRYFVNSIVGGVLLIYYGRFSNYVQRDIFQKLKVSAYRNYVPMRFYVDGDVLYFLIVDRIVKINKLLDLLKSNGFDQSYKLLMYRSKEYEGYAYLKIYSLQADRLSTAKALQERTGLASIMTFGSDGRNDVVLEKFQDEKAIGEMKRHFESYFWQKNGRKRG